MATSVLAGRACETCWSCCSIAVGVRDNSAARPSDRKDGLLKRTDLKLGVSMKHSRNSHLAFIGFAICNVCFLAGDRSVADERNRDELKAVARIEQLGGHVFRKKQLSDKPIWGIFFDSKAAVHDEDLEQFLGFESLNYLEMNQLPNITDAGMKTICQLKKLARLDLKQAFPARGFAVIASAE
jgi:hypothetical protein